MKSLQRSSSIEMLRIVLMLMIIVHHLIFHGLGLGKIESSAFRLDSGRSFEIFIDSFVIIAVNAFVFISGYYGINFKITTVVSFVLQILFYSVAFFLIFSVYDSNLWSVPKLIYAFVPISKPVWWFVSIYLCLYFVSPFLNKGCEHLDKRTLTVLLFGLLFFNCFSGFLFGTFSEFGYSIFNFVVIYVLARYLRKYDIEVKRPFLLYVISSVSLALVAILLAFNHKVSLVIKIFSYNNPLLIFSAAMLFFAFKRLDIKSNKLINLIAGQVIGVYLIHDYPEIRKLIAQYIILHTDLYSDNLPIIFIIFIYVTVAVFLFGITIEYFRKYLFDRLIAQIKTTMRSSPKAIRYRILLNRFLFQNSSL